MILLDAHNAQLAVSAQAGIAVEVLQAIPPDSGVISKCIGGTDVGSIGGTSPGQGPELPPLSGATTMVYSAKVASPSQTSFQIGAAAKAQNADWRITIAKASIPLRSDQAFVVLSNSTSRDKGLMTVNSSNCAAADQNVRVQMSKSAGFLISKADTSTLLLSRQTCRFRFIGCWDSSGWDHFATFDEAAFWNLFGGRQVTIDWIISTGE